MQLVYRGREVCECLIHHVALLEDKLRELILLAIDPEVRERLLSAVKYLDQIIERRRNGIVVQDSVSSREILSIVS